MKRQLVVMPPWIKKMEPVIASSRLKKMEKSPRFLLSLQAEEDNRAHLRFGDPEGRGDLFIFIIREFYWS